MSLTARAAPQTRSSLGLVDGIGALTLGASTAPGASQKLNELVKLKDKIIQEQQHEITALKASLGTVQKTLLAKQQEMEGAQERATSAQGSMGAAAKELAMVKADKKKLEAQLNELMRTNAKLREQLSRVTDKSPVLAAQVATLQSDVRAARSDGVAAGEEVKAMSNQLRSKQKELERMGKLVEEAQQVSVRNGELQNSLLEARSELVSLGEELRKSEACVRAREADVARGARELEAARKELSASHVAHADTSATLKAMSSRYVELEAEACRLRDENARLGAVASRVAASEVRSGSKDEGMVPVMQHLEEIKFWRSEVTRLKDKVAALEKQLSVADKLKDKWRTQAERAASAAPGAPDALPAAPLGTPPRRPRSASATRRSTTFSTAEALPSAAGAASSRGALLHPSSRAVATSTAPRPASPALLAAHISPSSSPRTHTLQSDQAVRPQSPRVASPLAPKTSPGKPAGAGGTDAPRKAGTAPAVNRPCNRSVNGVTGTRPTAVGKGPSVLTDGAGHGQVIANTCRATAATAAMAGTKKDAEQAAAEEPMATA